MRVTVWRSVAKLMVLFAVAACLWFLVALPGGAFASAPAGVDPARAAQEVFQSDDFWWKRVEPRTVSTSWFESIVTAVLEFLGRVFGYMGRLLARILRMLSRLFGVFPRRLVGRLGTDLGDRRGAHRVVGLEALPGDRELAQCSQGYAGARKRTSLRKHWPRPPTCSSKPARRFATGLYAEAIRLALLALIARLEKQGLLALRYDPDQSRVPDRAPARDGRRRVLRPTGADLRTGLVRPGVAGPRRSRSGDQSMSVRRSTGRTSLLSKPARSRWILLAAIVALGVTILGVLWKPAWRLLPDAAHGLRATTAPEVHRASFAGRVESASPCGFWTFPSGKPRPLSPSPRATAS